MPCEHVDLGNGVHALIRRPNQRPRHCSVCKRPLRDWKLCDFPTGIGKSQTCDRVLCLSCADHRPPDTDYCPEHGRMVGPGGKLKLDARPLEPRYLRSR